MNIFSSYYSDLHKSLEPPLEDVYSFLDKINLPCFLEEHKEQFDVGLLMERLKKAILQMKLGKTPGLDGLTVEFYRTFRDLIPYLKELFEF